MSEKFIGNMDVVVCRRQREEPSLSCSSLQAWVTLDDASG